MSRAEVAKWLVLAVGAGAQASKVASTDFLDNAKIPAALEPYVAEAVALGRIQGFPDNTFRPESYLTTQRMCTFWPISSRTSRRHRSRGEHPLLVGDRSGERGASAAGSRQPADVGGVPGKYDGAPSSARSSPYSSPSILGLFYVSNRILNP